MAALRRRHTGTTTDWGNVTPPPALAYATAAQRLAPYGLSTDDADCSISWFGPAGLGDDHRGSEAAVQAMAGLMYLHGRDSGRPRRLGVEVASVAAGVLAGQATLASLIGRHRGLPVAAFETSVLQAGLLQASHNFAASTSGEDWLPAGPGPAPGPPFRTADGCWFEMETLDPDLWKSFWAKLGGAGLELGWGWTLFRARYYRGTCSLPAGFHEATLVHTLDQVVDAGASCGVTISPVRSCADALAQPGVLARHPGVGELVAATAGSPTGATPIPSPDPGPGPGGAAAAAGAAGPLAGLRVVETTSRMQGPLAGLLLQMLGAHVTKVEPPGGDIGRGVPPLAGDTGSFFLCMNRGKEFAEIDLRSPAGRAELVDLVAGADAFLHNWRPGKAGEWGLDHTTLGRHHRRLVYAEASGWGPRPDSARLVGTDFPVQAFCGLGESLNPIGDTPAPSRVLLTDFMGALVACEGILGALYLREQDGRGRVVQTSLLAGAMTLQSHVLEALAAGREERREGGRPQWGPLDQPVPTADGWLTVSADDEDSSAQLRRTCGLPATAAADAVVERLGRRPGGEWEQVLGRAGVASAAVATDLATTTTDPRLADLFEPLAGGSVAPRTPWRSQCPSEGAGP